MKNVLIFGDSYSTYEGCIPEGYAWYYPRLDVEDAKDTWWNRFERRTGARLIRNDSWSGSTICHTGYDNVDCSETSSFLCRFDTLKKNGFFEKERIDTVLVFGGTNDSWAGVPLGEMQYSSWEKQDLFAFRPAVCRLAHDLNQTLPAAEIVFIVNTDLREEIAAAIKEAAARFDCKCVVLSDIEKQNGHPVKAGMEAICREVCEVLG